MGQHPREIGCSAEVPFEPSPEPLARYSGAAWLSWPGGEAIGAVLSEDDGARHSRGYRNRWRYWLTGAVGVGLPKGCAPRLVTVRALVGGLVAVDIDGMRLLILPGDPEAQDRLSRVAPTCEANRQLVSVEEIGGRWRITIEEPAWLPWTRERC
jgi:hypothetical protein